MILYRVDTEILNLGFNPDGKERRELMVERSVSISFELSDYVKLEKGDSIIHNGQSFYLNKDHIPVVNKSTNGYKYDLTFYDITERFKDFKLKYSFQGVDELEFKLTTTGDKFIDVVIYSLNKHGLGLFVKGVYPTEIKEIHFQNTNIFDALTTIAETYELEWWISDGSLNLGKLEFGASKLLRDDIELDSIEFNQSTEKAITRLYAFGSTKNLPIDYRMAGVPVDSIAERRLRLPGLPYVDLFTSLSANQIIEGVKIFDDIYPRQNNKIVEVSSIIKSETETTQETHIYTIKGDNTFTLTQQDIIAGLPLKIAFQTGYLAGREFELIIRDENHFEIKFSQEGNVYLPNPTLTPTVGDEFFFFNFKAGVVLPTLIPLAENELKIAALDFLNKLGSEYVYTCKTRSIKCEESNIDLQLGQVVTIQSGYLGSITSRVRAYEKDLYNKFECEYTIGDYSQYSRLSEIEGKIKGSTGSVVSEIGVLDNKFLRKDIEDNAHRLINFLEGIITKKITSPSYTPGMLGEGFTVDEFGNAVFDSITARTFLSVPEIRFNRTTVYTGIRWDTFGGGIIEDVEIDRNELGQELQSGIITLRLEDGEIGAVDVDDMCMGIFHNFGGSNETVSEDQQNANFRFKGFNTSYFRVTEVLESDNSRFRYALRGISEQWTQQSHPSQFMHFAAYSNPTNSDRQSSSYTTTNYSIRLKNMTTWEYGGANIYEISGKLDGFTIGETVLEGEGQAFGNAYIWGTLQQIYNDPLRLEVDTNGDNFLGFGETMTITCKVLQGWKDITDTVDIWGVSRETGNQNNDNAWNIAHAQFSGILALANTVEYSDLGDELSTLFRFSATSGENKALLYLTV